MTNTETTTTEATRAEGKTATKAKPAGKNVKSAGSKRQSKPADQKKTAKQKPIKAGTKASTPAKAKAKPASERAGTKTALVLELLRRDQGATTAEIAKATNWQNHSIRGFISGTVGKKMSLAVESLKNDKGERTYRIAQ